MDARFFFIIAFIIVIFLMYIEKVIRISRDRYDRAIAEYDEKMRELEVDMIKFKDIISQLEHNEQTLKKD